MKYGLLLAMAASLAFGNDAYFGTDGGNIFPQKSAHVRMLKEEISIDLDKGGGLVTCTFWFLNSGKSDTMTVGFPDEKITPASMTEPARDFKAWVNGVEAKVRRDSILEDNGPLDTLKDSWFHWRAYFPSGDTTIIRNRYFGLWGGSYCEKSFGYIIGTGNSWSGPIGEGRIVFHFGKVFSSLFAGKSVWMDSGDLAPEYFEDSAVFSFREYMPKDHERLHVWFSSYWGNMDSTSCPGFYIPIDSLKQKDEMINELFARHGHIFKSARLKRKYTRKSWYAPKREMKLGDLPKTVQNYILNLRSGKDKLLGHR